MTTPAAPSTSVESLLAAANADPEFTYAARFWSTRLRLEIGRTAVAIRILDGSVVAVDAPPRDFEPADLVIRADQDTWDQMMQPLPRPFYQDLWGAMYQHGVAVDGDIDVLCAYYPAVSRIVTLLRDGANR